MRKHQLYLMISLVTGAYGLPVTILQEWLKYAAHPHFVSFDSRIFVTFIDLRKNVTNGDSWKSMA